MVSSANWCMELEQNLVTVMSVLGEEQGGENTSLEGTNVENYYGGFVVAYPH